MRAASKKFLRALERMRRKEECDRTGGCKVAKGRKLCSNCGTRVDRPASPVTEWIGSKCGIVSPNGVGEEEYELGSDEPCVLCEHRGCIATVRLAAPTSPATTRRDGEK